MLAINGGSAIRDRVDWPRWPVVGSETIEHLKGVLKSGRWSISGFWTGQRTREQEFAERFAEYNDVRFCVPTANGTSSLTIALEALDVGAGDEVVVPGLTWVAPAVAVVSVNATPILVDIDLATGCLDAAAVESAVTERTRAIISVHAHCSMADLDSLVALAERHNLELIEDCAQSHGSRWRGRAAGSIGRIGIFSMHQGKPLTCGEGGAAITDDEALFHRMEQLRSNGRRYIAEQPRLGQMDLEQVGETLGTNLAMSEFHAALLLDGLNRLDDQIARKEANARRLDVALRSQRGWLPMERPWQVDRQSYYQYVVRYVPEMFSGRSVSDVCNALEAELGFRPHAIYPPMNRHLLYRPQTKKRHQWSEEYWNSLDPNRFHLPRADRAHSESLAFHHSVLLGSRDDMDAIAKAFEKVLLEAHTIPMQ